MDFLEFADRWLQANCPITTLYGDTIRRRVKALVMVFARQENDETAGPAIANYFLQLIDDYYKELKS